MRFEELVCFELTVSLFSRFDNFEECCNSIYGAFNANQWRKIKLGSFVSIWKKDQSTDLESGKKSSHEEGAHGGKLTLLRTCSECPQCSLSCLFISPVVIFAFTLCEVIEDNFLVRPFSTGTRRLRNF